MCAVAKQPKRGPQRRSTRERSVVKQPPYLDLVTGEGVEHGGEGPHVETHNPRGGSSSVGYGKSETARRPVPSGACVNTGESGLEPQPWLSMGQSRRPIDSLSDGRSTTSRFNGTNGLPTSNDGLLGLNCGIDRANPTSGRDWVSVGGPAMVALPHGGRRSARCTQRLTCNGSGKGKGRS
jgi:hypothetical protein